MPTPRELEQLLTIPNEGLTIEHKSWLNLQDNGDKARIAKAATQATATQIDDNLVEILHAMLSPLYERFAFFELPLRLVQEEVERLRGGRF